MLFDQYYPGKKAIQEPAGHFGKGYHNLVDDTNKVIWVMIPKNANTSIKQALDDVYLIKTEDVANYGYTKIGFIRNPYDRFQSCYRWAFFRDELPRTFEQYESLVNSDMTFAEFAQVVANDIPDEISDKHFRSQTTRIEDVGGLDFIGRVETLNEDWKTLQREFQLRDLPSERVNATSGNVEWTAHTRQLIYERYKKDFSFYAF